MREGTCTFIVTATPEFVRPALAELQAAAPDLMVARRFKDGIFMVETATALPRALVALRPVFVRHLMPVGAEVAVVARREVDLPAILAAAREVSGELAGRAFTVQCRCVGTHGYRARDVEVYVGEALEVAGGVPVLPEDEAPAMDSALQVIGIYVYGDTAFVGCASAAECLAPHCDECRLYMDQPRMVCRAELKLQEALRRFGLQVGPGRALDLGAAPGGWTRLLAGLGMQVVAVDPGELDPRVRALPGVVHVRGKAEAFESDVSFDLLVNDMYLAPLESAGVMVRVARYLRPGAPALMTAKLANRRSVAALAAVRAVLAPAYEELAAKNLFHNRREITLLLRRR